MDRLLVELEADGLVRVYTWIGGELPEPAGGAGQRLVWPVDEPALEEIRWYLEDYLRTPFGVYEDAGPRIADRLRSWGQDIFAAVFGSGAARDAYIRLRSRGTPLEIVFRSRSPSYSGNHGNSCTTPIERRRWCWTA